MNRVKGCGSSRRRDIVRERERKREDGKGEKVVIDRVENG